jgi:putative membrane protein
MSMMQRFALLKGFNWKVLLIRFIVNAVALLITVALVPFVTFVDFRWGTVTLLALGLGILNALIKPILQFLTLNFIFATYGFIVILINTLVLYLLAAVFRGRFAVESLFWAIIAATLLGLLSSVLENLLGATLPIIPEDYGDLHKRLQKEVPTTAQIVETLVETPTTLAPAELPAQPLAATSAAPETVAATADAIPDATEPAAAETPASSEMAGG